MKYAIMFNVLGGGDIEPIKWSNDELKSDRSIIVLEEMTPAVWLWHGNKQSLIARRVASRQAEALKGNGYKSGGTIIGSRTRIIKEIDEKKLGIDHTTDEFNIEFQKILNTKFDPLDEFVIIFQGTEAKIKTLEIKSKIVSETPRQIESESLIKDIRRPITINGTKEASGEPINEKTIQKVERQTISKGLESPEESLKNIKKTEYAFESYVQEIKTPETKLREEQVVDMTQPAQSPNIIKDMLHRIEKLEERLELLNKDFQQSLKKKKDT